VVNRSHLGRGGRNIISFSTDDLKNIAKNFKKKYKYHYVELTPQDCIQMLIIKTYNRDYHIHYDEARHFTYEQE